MEWQASRFAAKDEVPNPKPSTSVTQHGKRSCLQKRSFLNEPFSIGSIGIRVLQINGVNCELPFVSVDAYLHVM